MAVLQTQIPAKVNEHHLLMSDKAAYEKNFTGLLKWCSQHSTDMKSNAKQDDRLTPKAPIKSNLLPAACIEADLPVRMRNWADVGNSCKWHGL